MTHVINQGMAMYWGTSRWSSMEIMVGLTPVCPQALGVGVGGENEIRAHVHGGGVVGRLVVLNLTHRNTWPYMALHG